LIPSPSSPLVSVSSSPPATPHQGSTRQRAQAPPPPARSTPAAARGHMCVEHACAEITRLHTRACVRACVVCAREGTRTFFPASHRKPRDRRLSLISNPFATITNPPCTLSSGAQGGGEHSSSTDDGDLGRGGSHAAAAAAAAAAAVLLQRWLSSVAASSCSSLSRQQGEGCRRVRGEGCS